MTIYTDLSEIHTSMLFYRSLYRVFDCFPRGYGRFGDQCAAGTLEFIRPGDSRESGSTYLLPRTFQPQAR